MRVAMSHIINFPAQSGASRPYLSSKLLTEGQRRFILSLPISGDYGIPATDIGSIRTSLILMGYVEAGYSSRWGRAAARLTRRGCILHQKLMSKKGI